MKRWKLVKDQLDSKRNASSSNNNDSSRPAPPYMGGGISSASFSDFRDLHSTSSSSYDRSPSTSNLMLPTMSKSTSRTSLDIPGRLNNFMSKSSSSKDLGASAAAALKRFPRPRARTNSNNFISSDAVTSSSPPKVTSPRKWVNSLLNQAGPSTQQLETRAQAHTRAESDASMSTPAPVSSLVLSSSNAQPSSRQVYTIDSGLQRKTSSGGRSASIYSSHLSSASRSTPDLHRNSVTRHLDNGALHMDLSGPLPSIAHRTANADGISPTPPLVVRNLDEAPRGTYTPSIPAASASAQLRTVSKLRNPWSVNSPQIRSEEEDDIDASIAHDRSSNRLALGEQAVLDMLDSASGVGSAVSAPVPPTPYQTATPGTLHRSRSFAASTHLQSPSSEYSQDLRSPFLAGTSSPAAGVREAIRQRELLDSGASRTSAPRSPIPASRSVLSQRTSAFLSDAVANEPEPLRTSQTSSATFYQRHTKAFSSDDRKISRVPVPTTELRLLSPPASAATNTFALRGASSNPISPIDSSLLGTSANATSLWSRPGNAPDTPSTTQDPTSPMPWSSASSIPPKWPTSSQQDQLSRGDKEKSIYAVEAVQTPSETKGQDLAPVTATKPNLLRQRTDFTEATSIFSGSEGFGRSQGSLQKETITETQGTEAGESPADAEASTLTSDAAAHRPLSHAVSVSSSLAAIRGMFSKAASVAVSTTETSGSATRPTEAIPAVTPSTSVAAVAKELEQRSTTPSRPSSPEKLAMLSSPTKAKDLIAMFESNSATASPTEQSFSFSRNATPKSKLSPTKCGTANVDSALKRQTPLAISVSRSNLGLAASASAVEVTAEESSSINTKLRAQRFEVGRLRSRRAGLIGVGGGEGDDAGFSFSANDYDDEGADENAAPDSVVSAERSVSGRFRSHGASSQLSQSLSMSSAVSGNVLASGQVSSPASRPPFGSSSIDKSSGSIGTNSGSLGKKGAFRSSVIGFMGVLSGKPTTTTGTGNIGPTGASGPTLAPDLLSERRHSTKSDQDDNVSTASAATQGTTASYRRKKEEGNLPLTSVTAIQMSGEQPGTKPLRAGVLYYFNVHDPNPRWLRVKAVLLPSAVAMSWIPAGGGRENVVLDLRACREVHSVPSPDHPSSSSDVGAACARRQGLDQINPFQLIFDDGVERLAADSAKERVQWVSSVWDVAGAGGVRPDSPHGSALANSGHGASPRAARADYAGGSPVARARGLGGSSPTRPFGSPVTSQRPASMRPGSNEEAIDRIGSIWKSELSSELTNRDAHPSFGETMTSATASVPPPLPPKETSLGRTNTPLSATKTARSLPTPTAAALPMPNPVTTSSAPLLTTSASNSLARAKVRSWQRPPLDTSTGFVHDLAAQTPTLVQPATEAVHSTPASYADDRSSAASSSHTAKGDESPAMSSPELDGYESARSQSSEVDEFGPRSPVSEAMFNWSRLDKESDLNPSDSASQRPARSEFGTIKSNVSGAERRSSQRRKNQSDAKDVEASKDAAGERTPAQLLRDSVIQASVDNRDTFNPDLAGRGERLGTVIEETQSQTQSTRLNASLRSNARSKLDDMVARAIGTGSINPSTAKSALSLASTGSINSQEVNKLLELLEGQQRARLTKEKELEEQIRGFQQVVSDLQKRSSLSSSRHSARRRSSTSTAGGESKLTHRSSRDSDLAAMQEKLDKVLDLVTNVVAAPVVHQRARSESTALLGSAYDGDDAEVARIEGVLAKLLRRMQVSEEAAMTPNSKDMVRAAVLGRDPSMVDEWDRMPVELRGNELVKSMEDRAKHGKDGRHEAIQADYGSQAVSAEMARGSSAPAGAVEPLGVAMDAEIDPRRRLSSSMPRRVSGASVTPSASATDLDAASTMSRLPPRSWTSERGVPSPPPNSEWDAKSLLSRPGSRATTHTGMGRAPAQNFRMLGDPVSTQATPRPVMVTNEPSYGSLDMEAEIRRRRAQQQAASGANVPSAQQGGWYTPKVAQTEGHESQESSSSVTVETPSVNLDKPVPPTPSVRWAVGDIVTDPKAADVSTPKTTDGLGLSMSGDPQFAGTPGVGSVGGTSNAELATILQALKQSEMARQTQLQQQTEISRYLNELNAWLERDVVDRSKEWRTLASGVTQLHDELKALKEGRTLPASTTNPVLQLTDASHPSTPVAAPAATIGDVHLSPTPSAEKPLFTMGDKANAPRSPSRRKPAGTRKWNQQWDPSTPKPHDASTWYKPDDAPQPTLKRAAGAGLVRQALREWERFKTLQRAQGKPEDPLPAEATGDPAVDSQLPLPQPVMERLREAVDEEDADKVGDVVRESAEAGYGTQAIIELTKHVESKTDEGDDQELDGETLMPTPSPAVTPPDEGAEEDAGVIKMATPVPARVAAKDKSKPTAEEQDSEPASGPTTAALALAVEEILKHLLTSKEEAKKQKTEEASRTPSLLSLQEKDKNELVELLYTRIAADKAAEVARQKDLDPKSAIESLVAAINAQKENEIKSAAAADAALRQMASDLLKTTSEQNSKLVEAVNAASRDMLRNNVQQHADEFKRLLHKEVSSMFEDVGKIREAKRHLEFEIADLWSIKSRHLQTGAGMPITYNVPGGFPAGPPPGGMMPMPMPMAMPVPVHVAAHPPAHITPIPAPAPAPMAAPRAADGVDSLRAQKRAVKAALRQAVAETAPAPAAAPAPAPAPAAPTAAPAPTNFLTKRKDVLNPFSINFGPRAPVAK